MGTVSQGLIPDKEDSGIMKDPEIDLVALDD